MECLNGSDRNNLVRFLKSSNRMKGKQQAPLRIGFNRVVRALDQECGMSAGLRCQSDLPVLGRDRSVSIGTPTLVDGHQCKSCSNDRGNRHHRGEGDRSTMRTGFE